MTDVHSEFEKPIGLEDVQILRSIGRKSLREFTDEDMEKAKRWLYKSGQELGIKSTFLRAWFGEWRQHDRTAISMVTEKGESRGIVINDDTNWEIQVSRKVEKETKSHGGSSERNAVKYLPYIMDITKKAILFDTAISDKVNENSLMYHTFYAYTEVMGYPALLKLRVEELFYCNNETSGIIRRNYILQNIKEESLSERNQLSRLYHLDKNPSIYSIADLYELVKNLEEG